jgi:hypothetical protein
VVHVCTPPMYTICILIIFYPARLFCIIAKTEGCMSILVAGLSRVSLDVQMAEFLTVCFVHCVRTDVLVSHIQFFCALGLHTCMGLL